MGRDRRPNGVTHHAAMAPSGGLLGSDADLASTGARSPLSEWGFRNE